MADRARVTSVEAIEAFRARLIIFLTKARPTLEEVSNEVVRTRQWLQNDQRRFWETELRARAKKYERAQAELLSATMSRLQQATAAQQMAVRKARDAMREAEEKLSLLKKWDRELYNRSEPMLKLVNQLHDFLVTDMPRAVAFLNQVLRSLEAYAGVTLPGSGTSSTGPPGETSESPDSPAAPGSAGDEGAGGGEGRTP
jgi:hypothetical protein